MHSSNIGPWRVSTGPSQVMVALSSSANLIKNSSLYSTPLRLWQSKYTPILMGKLTEAEVVEPATSSFFANLLQIINLIFDKIEHSIETLHQWLWECSAASSLLDDNWASISSSLVWSWSSEKWGEVGDYQNQIKILLPPKLQMNCLARSSLK